MHQNHTQAHLTTRTHTYVHGGSPSKTNSTSSHCVTAHVMLIFVIHFIRQGAERAILGENGNSLLVALLKRRLQ